MLGLTTLGLIHTMLGLIAVGSGTLAIVRHREIQPRRRLDQIYLAGTFLTAATALAIFERGSFNLAHVLAVMTIAALVVGTIAAFTSLFGTLARYIQAIGYTTTFLFQALPGITEVLIRLPPGSPLVSSVEAPQLKVAYGVLLLMFVVALLVQLRWLRRQVAE